jgi:hypothetical protein
MSDVVMVVFGMMFGVIMTGAVWKSQPEVVMAKEAIENCEINIPRSQKCVVSEVLVVVLKSEDM